MATTKLALYNIALFACGERALVSLSEDREPRRLLDEIWTRGGGGAVRYVLEQGTWDFASRAVLIDASDTVTPAFGFSYAFDLPTDFVRLVDISGDAEFGDPLLYYQIEGAYIYANIATIYLRYVSDHVDYGNDLSLWPETFTLWAGHWLATQLAPRLKSDIDMAVLKETSTELLISARLKNMSQGRLSWPPASFDEIDPRHLDHALEMLRLNTRRSSKEER